MAHLIKSRDFLWRPCLLYLAVVAFNSIIRLKTCKRQKYKAVEQDVGQPRLLMEKQTLSAKTQKYLSGK